VRSDRAIVALPVPPLLASRITHCRVDVLTRETPLSVEEIRLGGTLGLLQPR
jgi:hypothetical protein